MCREAPAVSCHRHWIQKDFCTSSQPYEGIAPPAWRQASWPIEPQPLDQRQSVSMSAHPRPSEFPSLDHLKGTDVLGAAVEELRRFPALVCPPGRAVGAQALAPKRSRGSARHECPRPTSTLVKAVCELDGVSCPRHTVTFPALAQHPHPSRGAPVLHLTPSSIVTCFPLRMQA